MFAMDRDRPKILIVEDDADLRDTLACYLDGQGYPVAEAADGRGMRERLAEGVSLVLLDVNLPGEDGFSLARELRAHSEIGIIMITGRTDLIDRVVGLEIGADDYIAKPFQLRELLARIKAVLRRSHHLPAAEMAAPLFTFDGWILDPQRQKLTDPGGGAIPLTTTEFAILHQLVSAKGGPVSRQDLYEVLKGRDWSPLERSLDVHVGNLRRKLEASGRYPRLIKSVHGIGYRLVAGNLVAN